MRRIALILCASAGFLGAGSSAAFGASYNVYICGQWSTSTGPLVPAYVPGTIAEAMDCSGVHADLEVSRLGYQAVPNGQGASWTATAPAGLSITHIYTTGDNAFNVGSGNGWWGEFFWNGGPGPAGRSGQITNNFITYGCCQASFNAQTVGWFMACGWSSCSQPGGIDVGGVDLGVDETQGPWLVAPSGLWQASGWIRDRYQLVFPGTRRRASARSLPP